MDRETDFVGDIFKIAFTAVTEMSQAAEAARLQAIRQRLEVQRVQHLQATAKARELRGSRQTALNEQRRKLLAWEKFYQPAPGCLTAVSVGCGNAHIRARREFDRRYAAGEFQSN